MLSRRKGLVSGPRRNFYCLAIAVLFFVPLASLFHRFFSSQCFSRVVPSIPLHGLEAVPELSFEEFNQIDFINDYQMNGVPLVVRGYAKDWPAMQKWQDLTYFGGKSCKNFRIKHWGLSLGEYTKALSDIEKAHTEEEFEQMVELGDHYFKHNEELFYECPELYADVMGFPLARAHASKPETVLAKLARLLIGLFSVEYLPVDFINGEWLQAVTWIGPPGSKTLLHYDDDPLSLLIQFRGQKIIRMYSPDQSPRLYPQSVCQNLEEYGTRFSRFSGNPFNMTVLEKQRFPNISSAAFLDVQIYPSDMLYIPSGWWHYVGVHAPNGITAISVATRAYSTCEGLSYLPNFIANWMHSNGLLNMKGFCLTPEGLL